MKIGYCLLLIHSPSLFTITQITEMQTNQTSNYKLQTTNFKWLLFLSKVAFICNICFLIAFSIQMTDWIRNQDISSTIALIGYLMGFIINPVLVFCYFVLFVISRKKLRIIPSWLLTANILFLIIQILYIFYLNDTRHT